MKLEVVKAVNTKGFAWHDVSWSSDLQRMVMIINIPEIPGNVRVAGHQEKDGAAPIDVGMGPPMGAEGAMDLRLRTEVWATGWVSTRAWTKEAP